MPHRKIPTALGDFGRFTIQRKLGAGEFAVVYQAHDRNTHRTVALKLLEQVDPRALGRFEREFGRLRHVHHPNLVELYDLFSDDDETFFTMELVEGSDLVSWVREDAETRPPSGAGGGLLLGQAVHEAGSSAYRPATPRGTRRLYSALPQLVSGLEAIHAAGLVHRDLRPSNVRVTPAGRLVILDFGLMTHTGDSPDDDVHVGTAAYMAPEQWEQAGAKAASDMYAVGVLLFEALTGVLPFSGSAHEVFVRKRTVDAPRPSSLVDTVPADLDDYCAKLLHGEPSRRPTAADLAKTLAARD